MDMSKVTTYWIVLFVIWAGIEFNAIKGKLGPMTTVKGVITSGFILNFIIYFLMEIIL